MLHLLAHNVLKDLNHAGAVIGPKGDVLEVNNAFKAAFFDKQAGGKSAPCKEFQAALRSTGTRKASRAPAEAAIIHRNSRRYRLDVYFLDKPSDESGLRLAIATLLDQPHRKMGGASEGASEKLSPRFAALIGQDTAFVQALLLAQRAAQTDLPALILGESGTGKEILARTIHQSSRRRQKPFVDVNCAAIPDSLVESELFGYEKGAFTGASSKGKAGFFENAHQGTIFMDEIGDAASQTQAKLLRVLESGQFKRIGGNRNITVDVRLISATNQELSRRIAAGHFRADLLYRINTITIHLPPLRERKNDLPLLAEHFLNIACLDRKEPLRFSKEAMTSLASYSWPGNVRELKGVIDYAVTMATGKVLTPRSFPGFLRTGCAGGDPLAPGATPSAQPPHEPLRLGPRGAEAAPVAAVSVSPQDPGPDTDLLVSVIESAEKNHIRKILERSRTRSEAIRRLGISRRTFYAKLKLYGLE